MRLGFSISPDVMHRAGEFREAGIAEAEISLFSTRESVEQALEEGGRVFDAVTAAGIGVWSVHLPSSIGPKWDICALDEDERRQNLLKLNKAAPTDEAKA